MNSNRPHLMESYKQTVGGFQTGRLGKERGLAETAAMASITHEPNEREVKRFKTHGIANIKLDVQYASVEFVIDLDQLNALGAIQYCWLSKQKPDELRLVVSNGKQTPKKNTTQIDPDRSLEGIRITLVSKSRTQVPSHYEAILTPLYLDVGR